jgi:hypothetical protein
MGDARRKIAVENIRHVLMAADDQQLLGLASQHDVTCAMHSFLDDSLDQSLTPEVAQVALEQIMLTEACTTTPGSSLRQAAQVLQGH